MIQIQPALTALSHLIFLLGTKMQLLIILKAFSGFTPWLNISYKSQMFQRSLGGAVVTSVCPCGDDW